MSEAVIIDYGSGNLHSAKKAFERAARDAGLPTRVSVTSDPAAVRAADHIVLPGVGAFAECKRGLDAVAGMREALEDTVIAKGRPFLGICVGMQLMADRGLEFETVPGLGWIAGDVTLIRPVIKAGEPSLKIPHMGWNSLTVSRSHPVLAGIHTGPDGHHAYFVHSYHLSAADPATIIAETYHGVPVTAVVGRDNLVGTQFHPEKSQALGLALIANFLRWTP